MSEIKDDVISFNTEQQAKQPSIKKVEPKVFSLVPETDPILKQVLPEFDFNNPPVNPMEFASSLVETCKLHKGIGLAANQCGFKHRVFVMGAGDEYVAFFNPKIFAYTLRYKGMVRYYANAIRYKTWLSPRSVHFPEKQSVG